MKMDTIKATAESAEGALFLGDDWFDPLEAGVRTRVRRGSHVANCGFIVAANASRRGVARAMCAHSLERARGRGFTAMQFNFVISSNERAVRLWQDCGFAIVGTLPGAFAHPIRGLIDAYVMYRSL